MGSSPQPPSPPDPTATAAAQGKWNFSTAQEQQQLNNTNQNTPYGSINYAQNGNGSWVNTPSGQQWVPQTTATTTLSPGMQKLFDTTQGNAQTSADTASSLGHNVQDMLSKNVDLSNSATSNYLDNLNRQTLDPQYANAQTQLNQHLADQGLTPGSEGWKTAQTQFGLNKSNAYNNMYLQGHNTAVQDIMAQYNQPLNSLNALKSGAQVNQPGIGNLAPSSQQNIQSPNYEGIVQSNYDAATKQYQSQVQSQNAMMGGVIWARGEYSPRRNGVSPGL